MTVLKIAVFFISICGMEALSLGDEGTKSILGGSYRTFALSGDQAKAHGGGIGVIAGGLIPDGGSPDWNSSLFFDFQTARFASEKASLLFKKDEDLSSEYSLLKIGHGYSFSDRFHLLGLIGLGQLIVEGEDTTRNFGAYTLGLMGWFELSYRWNLLISADYFLPIEERFSSITYRLYAWSAGLTIAYSFH